jgi:hypothetical protein
MVRVKAIGRRVMQDLKMGFHSFGESLITFINTLLLTVVYLLGVGMSALLMGKK